MATLITSVMVAITILNIINAIFDYCMYKYLSSKPKKTLSKRLEQLRKEESHLNDAVGYFTATTENDKNLKVDVTHDEKSKTFKVKLPKI